MQLQFREVAPEDLAPAAFVGEPRLDPTQRLRDRLLFLLEPLESTVDLVEVPEDLLPEFGEPAVRLVKSTVGRRESTVDLTEPVVDLGEPCPRNSTSCWYSAPVMVQAGSRPPCKCAEL